MIRRVNEALDKVRIRLQGEERQGRRGLLFHNRHLLLRKVEGLSSEEQVKLSYLLTHYPELGKAWSLKESLRQWYKSLSRDEAEVSLCIWEDSIRKSRLKEFGALLSMFRNWRNEILNYSVYHVTNGFLEGKNKRIKVIKRVAYGYRNVDNLRRRIFLSNNETAANTKVAGDFHTY